MNFSNYTVLLKSALAIIVFLFGAFNGFLTKLAPPDPADELELPIGIAKFTCLAILLFVSLLCNFKALNKMADQKKFVSLWLWIGGSLIVVFVVSSLFYYNNFNEKTIWHRAWQARLVKGTTLTDESKQICKEDGHNKSAKDCEQYLLYKYYNADQINLDYLLWTEDSVRANRKTLVYTYIFVVVSISSLLFSLVELLSWNLFKKKERTSRKTIAAT